MVQNLFEFRPATPPEVVARIEHLEINGVFFDLCYEDDFSLLISIRDYKTKQVEQVRLLSGLALVSFWEAMKSFPRSRYRSAGETHLEQGDFSLEVKGGEVIVKVGELQLEIKEDEELLNFFFLVAEEWSERLEAKREKSLSTEMELISVEGSAFPK